MNNPSDQKQPRESMPAPSSHRKDLRPIVAGLIVVVLLVIIGAWYVYSSNSFSISIGRSFSITIGKPKETTVERSDRLILARQDDQKEYYQKAYSIYSRSITTGEETQIMTLPKDTYISNSITHGSQQYAFVATSPRSETESVAVYYSDDSGKSFKKVYTTDSPEAQITSLIFSSDGKSLAVALLPKGEDNHVFEIDLKDDYPTKQLFTIDRRGVFIEGYGREQQKILYRTGCFNCGGNDQKELLIYDIASDKHETFYTASHNMIDIAVNDRFTKVFTGEGEVATEYDVEAPFGGVDPPPTYSIKAPFSYFTIDIATKIKRPVTTIDNGYVGYVGYTPSGVPYISTTKKVIKIDNNTPETLLETEDDILEIISVSDDNAAVITVPSDRSFSRYSVLSSELRNPVAISAYEADRNTLFLGYSFEYTVTSYK